MAAATSFQNAFTGKVEQDEFTQVADLEAHWSGGFIPSWVRNLVTRVAKSQTFVFVGLSDADAHTTAAQTVRDFSSKEYTVPMSPSVTDGSSGTKVFETESVQVRRRRLSPGLWEVVVKRTGSQYYVNNQIYINGPAWAFGS